MASGGIALVVGALLTPVLIRWLRRRRLGQQIRDDGPFMHFVKAGTPTMGGVAMVVAAAIGYVLGHVGTHVAFSRAGVLVVLVTVCAGGVGFVDDWTKVRHQRSIGLTKRAKSRRSVMMSVGFALAAEHWVGVNTHLSYTRWDSVGIDSGSVGWIFWAVFVIVGTANAVNLTDGLDGLASGSRDLLLRGAGNHRVLAVSSFLPLPRFLRTRPCPRIGRDRGGLPRLPVVERSPGAESSWGTRGLWRWGRHWRRFAYR